YRSFMGAKGAAIDVNVNKSSDQRSGWKERLAEFIRATLFIPDARVGWLLTAVKRGVELCTQYNIDAIYSSAPPYTCALIARSIKRKTKLPWVAGFRDPWTDFLTTPDRWFLPAAIDHALERSVFNEADAIECAWTGIADDAFRKYPHLDRSKFYHVPNGFDSADFPQVQYSRNERFTITYTGSMYGRRTPRAFLDALARLNDKGLVLPQDVHLRFVGRFGDEIHAMMDSSPFAPCIEKISYVPHEQSVGYLMRSEASLLIVDDTKESAEIVPGKVYEYLGVGRPVIALAPRGSAIARLLDETQAGRSAPLEDIEAIAEIISTFIERWKSGLDCTTPLHDVIAKYERKESAKELGRILTKVTS
ncbi:MAG: glycosyltransferase, partial [Ignavibacteria bacterium]